MTSLHLTGHEHVGLRAACDQSLEVEVTYLPGGRAPVAHLHPEQDETFEILDGTLTARIDGEERTFAAGDAFEVPRGTVHQMWNATEQPVRAIWRTSPALDTLAWFRGLDALTRAGRTGMLDVAPLLARHRREFRLAGPRPVTAAATRVLAAAAAVKPR
jgi:quercetin dioxygenase-like cupin family protein